MKADFAVKGMSCGGCAVSVKNALLAQPGVHGANVNVADAKVSLDYDDNTNLSNLKSAVMLAGYDIEIPAQLLSGKVKAHGFWGDAEKWKRASFNTLNCLIGCSIGDFGAIVILQSFFPGTSMTAQMVIAIISGLSTSISLETVLLHRREGFTWQQSFTTALSMSFLSMIAMETAMNFSDFMITGGKSAFTSPTYWMAFGVAAVLGFLTPLPYNYYRLKKHNKACH